MTGVAGGPVRVAYVIGELGKGGAEFNNPAFVVFTSGSTGVPKGIILEHAALYSSIDAHAKLLNIAGHADNLGVHQ